MTLALTDLPFEELARRHGTPFYLYSLPAVRAQVARVRAAFAGEVELLYAVKANSNLEVLKALRADVDGLDISSAGELDQALLAGYDARQLGFAGPGKSAEELARALDAGVGVLSIESLGELERVAALAASRGRKASIALRINPTRLIRAFPLKMGGQSTQFGIDEEELPAALDAVRRHAAHLDLSGLHVYAGTQCLDAEAIGESLATTLAIAEKMNALSGSACRTINLGGGFGVSTFEPQRTLDLDALGVRARALFAAYRATSGSAPRILLELGRYLIAEAGIYVARIVDDKVSRGERFYVLDGGMNHHLAASGNLGMRLRQNYPATNLSRPHGEPVECHLVGPLCTPMDLMGSKVRIASAQVGDLVGFTGSGSYGLTASPLLFLGHPTPVELLHDGQDVRVVRARRTLADFN